MPGAGNEQAPLCAFVFKVQHLDRVWNYVRVVRGRLQTGGELVRAHRPGSDAACVGEVWTVRADRHEVVPSAGPGEIVVVPGDFGWRTGDTVCDPADPVALPAPRFPAPVLAVTFEPERADDAPPVHAALLELASDDPTLRVARERDASRGVSERARAGIHIHIISRRQLHFLHD